MVEELLAKSWLAAAVRTAGLVDAELWTLNVGERARVAAVFHALRLLVDSSPHRWAVDSEYNRAGDSAPKPAPRSVTAQADDEAGLGTPDVVVHRRGLSGPVGNLLVVEFKTSYDNLELGSRDMEKIEYWTTKFGYHVGAVVGFGPNRTSFDPKVRWLSSGEWSTRESL